jgi:hypothetical protein
LKAACFFFTQISAETMGGMFCYIINLFQGYHCFDSCVFGPPKIARLFTAMRDNVMLGTYLLPFGVYEFFSRCKMIGVRRLAQQQELNAKV